MTMTRIGVMQDFPREEKRRLRAERAVRDAARSDAAAVSAAANVRRETAAAWFARRYAEEAERAIAAQIAEAELAVVAAGAAYRANKAPQAELLMAQSVVIELANRATEAKAQTRRARIALARYLGADAERSLGDAPDLARLPAAVAELTDVDAQAEVRAAHAQEAYLGDRGRSRPGRQAAGLERRAVLRRPRVGVRQHGVADVLDRPAVVARHAAGPRAGGEAEGTATPRARCATTRGACVPPRSRRWSPSGSRRAPSRSGCVTELLPLNALRREAALAAYRGGTGTLAAVLEARRAELDIALALLQMEQAAARAWA